MNSALTWDDHATKILQTVFGCIRCLSICGNFLSTQIKLKLVQSLLIPHFLYADVIIGEPNDRTFRILKRAFNSMVRFVFNLRRFDHLSHLSSTVTGLELRTFLQYHRCLFLFNIISTQQPGYLYERLRFQSSVRLHRNVIPPRYNYLLSSYTFFIHDVNFWNRLPNHVKLSLSTTSFKTKLLEHLMSL